MCSISAVAMQRIGPIAASLHKLLMSEPEYPEIKQFFETGQNKVYIPLSLTQVSVELSVLIVRRDFEPSV